MKTKLLEALKGSGQSREVDKENLPGNQPQPAPAKRVYRGWLGELASIVQDPLAAANDFRKIVTGEALSAPVEADAAAIVKARTVLNGVAGEDLNAEEKLRLIRCFKGAVNPDTKEYGAFKQILAVLRTDLMATHQDKENLISAFADLDEYNLLTTHELSHLLNSERPDTAKEQIKYARAASQHISRLYPEPLTTSEYERLLQGSDSMIAREEIIAARKKMIEARVAAAAAQQPSAPEVSEAHDETTSAISEDNVNVTDQPAPEVTAHETPQTTDKNAQFKKKREQKGIVFREAVEFLNKSILLLEGGEENPQQRASEIDQYEQEYRQWETKNADLLNGGYGKRLQDMLEKRSAELMERKNTLLSALETAPSSERVLKQPTTTSARDESRGNAAVETAHQKFSSTIENWSKKFVENVKGIKRRAGPNERVAQLLSYIQEYEKSYDVYINSDQFKKFANKNPQRAAEMRDKIDQEIKGLREKLSEFVQPKSETATQVVSGEVEAKQDTPADFDRELESYMQPPKPSVVEADKESKERLAKLEREIKFILNRKEIPENDRKKLVNEFNDIMDKYYFDLEEDYSFSEAVAQGAEALSSLKEKVIKARDDALIAHDAKVEQAQRKIVIIESTLEGVEGYSLYFNRDLEKIKDSLSAGKPSADIDRRLSLLSDSVMYLSVIKETLDNRAAQGGAVDTLQQRFDKISHSILAGAPLETYHEELRSMDVAVRKLQPAMADVLSIKQMLSLELRRIGDKPPVDGSGVELVAFSRQKKALEKAQEYIAIIEKMDVDSVDSYSSSLHKAKLSIQQYIAEDDLFELDLARVNLRDLSGVSRIEEEMEQAVKRDFEVAENQAAEIVEKKLAADRDVTHEDVAVPSEPAPPSPADARARVESTEEKQPLAGVSSQKLTLPSKPAPAAPLREVKPVRPPKPAAATPPMARERVESVGMEQVLGGASARGSRRESSAMGSVEDNEIKALKRVMVDYKKVASSKDDLESLSNAVKLEDRVKEMKGLGDASGDLRGQLSEACSELLIARKQPGFRRPRSALMEKAQDLQKEYSKFRQKDKQGIIERAKQFKDELAVVEKFLDKNTNPGLAKEFSKVKQAVDQLIRKDERKNIPKFTLQSIKFRRDRAESKRPRIGFLKGIRIGKQKREEDSSPQNTKVNNLLAQRSARSVDESNKDESPDMDKSSKAGPQKK